MCTCWEGGILDIFSMCHCCVSCSVILNIPTKEVAHGCMWFNYLHFVILHLKTVATVLVLIALPHVHVMLWKDNDILYPQSVPPSFNPHHPDLYGHCLPIFLYTTCSQMLQSVSTPHNCLNDECFHEQQQGCFTLIMAQQHYKNCLMDCFTAYVALPRLWWHIKPHSV